MYSKTFACSAIAALLIFGRHSMAGAQTGVAAPSPAVSPSPSPSPSSSPLTEIGRVFTPDRQPEPIGQSSRVTFVVDRATIDAEGARTVADALVGVPGVELFPYGPFGAQTDFGIRGATSARTLVLVDGQPVDNPTTGSVDLTQLSTVGVGRVEIVESAGSSLYGTSASGGIINIITSVPRGEYVEVSDGSYGNRDVRADAGNGILGASFERHVATNDFSYPTFTYGPPGCTTVSGSSCTFPGAVRENDYGMQSTGRVSLDVPLGDGFNVRGRADTTSLDIGIPNRLDFLTPNTTTRGSNNTALLEIGRTSASNTLSLDLSGATQRSAYADPSFGQDDVVWGRTQLSLKDAFALTRVNVVTGIDLDRASGVFSFPGYSLPASGSSPATTVAPSSTGSSQSQAAAYLQVSGEPAAWSRVTAGLRAEHDSPAGSVLAPSFGTVLRLTPMIRLAGNVSESFAVPTLQDLYYPGFANPNLKPEKALDSDATIVFDSAHGSLSLGWFARGGSNFIVLNPVTLIPYNAQRAQTAGVAVTARSHPIDGLVADVNFTDLYEAIDLTSGGRLPRDPVGQASMGLTHPFGPTRTAFGIRFGIVGSDGDDTANVPPPVTGRYDSYTSLDAYIRYKLAQAAILSVRGFNLGDDREAPIFGYPNVGRRVEIEVSTR